MSKSDETTHLCLRGVRENNLKELSLELEHDRLTVITGVSGSGKSTLAFDTIYAEGGRRYIETFSPYTRQFLDRLHRPELDAISGVRPALALEQRNRTTSSRSTVGTVTEINDYLKVLWSQLSILICPNCDREVTRDSPARIAEKLLGDEVYRRAEALLVCFPLRLSGEAQVDSVIESLQAQGFIRYFDVAEKKIKRIEQLTTDAAASELIIVVDRLRGLGDSALGSAKAKALRERLIASCTQAYTFGHGTLSILRLNEEETFAEENFVESLRCSSCGNAFPDPKPSLFSFNSPLGACSECHGFGQTLQIDPQLIVPDPRKSIAEGAIACWTTDATSKHLAKLKKFCSEQGIDTTTPWRKLRKKEQELILKGDAEVRGFSGVFGWFKRLETKRHKMHVRVLLSRYRQEVRCRSCDGSRLTPAASLYRVHGKTLPEIWQLPLERVREFLATVNEHSVNSALTEVALEEVLSRINYLVDIGLDYLTLDRQSRTLSGGESQRVNLTSILGARLVNTMLVLDEPTIGLHPRDTRRLLETLTDLRDRGNTVLVVEHDPEVIAAGDEVLDLGPLSGNNGGQIVYQGPVSGLRSCKDSLTGQYFAAQLPEVQKTEREEKQGTIRISKARANNLQELDLEIPLRRVVMLTGVSGSGKSTLVNKCLYEPYRRLRQGFTIGNIRNAANAPIDDLKGYNEVDDIVLIDQQPIGKSPRSNAATYTKAWDVIRECLAETPAAERLGLSKSAFSFNVDGGRCPACKGAGQVKIEMQFLADVHVECETCGGERFQDQVLTVRLGEKNVLEILHMSLQDAVEFFPQHTDPSRSKAITQALQPLIDLGLGYLRLGHPLSDVSGGEAQRVKLASYLRPGIKERCLFILDEPTTGLHPYNINDLLQTFEKLIAAGHSILCVEHNLDVIAFADWIIDLGPEGGEHGGRLVAEGRPEDYTANTKLFENSYTARLLAERETLLQRKKSAHGAKQKSRVAGRRVAGRKQKNAIEVFNARQHNLKNVSVKIPHKELTVVTGVSGSGKSTLAFDVVFAEGQRRYIDCLSPYARQYIKQLTRADVDRINFIPPTIAVSQKTAPPLGVSTIATVTELYQYLRLLYAKLGSQHCVDDNTPVTSLSIESITSRIIQQHGNSRVFLFAPVISGRKGYYNDLFNRALKADISEALIDGSLVSLHPELRLERHKLHWISLAVGSINKPKKNEDLLAAAVQQCLMLGHGEVEVYVDDVHGEPSLYSTERVCPTCGRGYRELDPQDFSFRSARGVCGNCGGRGRISRKGAEECCPVCEGSRIAATGRHVYIEGKRIDALTAMTSPELLNFLEKLELPARLNPVLEPILRELKSRLSVIISVGLDYLQLDRDASSISGGEAQRLRLARTLGSPLTGVCYVLDEPSIGLHPEDQTLLMDTLFMLRDAGNTVVVVEHDEDTIRQADYVIDVGPHGGARGGEIVVAGSVAEVEANTRSQTGRALRERSAEDREALKARLNGRTHLGKPEFLELQGARTNNLKNVTARLPLNRLTAVVGVSGAGKSSLVHETLVPAIVEEFEGAAERGKFYQKTWDTLNNLGSLERLIEIDQSPVGKTSTSTPASYLGIFNDIRKIYAALPEAKTRGWAQGHFSFNSGKGRCDTCEGRGYLKIPMSFLPDAHPPCDACGAMRYNDETLGILYQGLSIGELLQKTFTEARLILANHSRICRSLDYVLELGLGYLTLGQPTHTLSGGEAQRLKIARELGLREAKNTLYILDEPTTGLHMVDVEKLLNVLFKLVDMGNTVVVIEHNLDIIRSADYLVELGPGPGAQGGTILFEGSPAELALGRKKTPTRRHLLPSGTESKEAADERQRRAGGSRAASAA